MTAQTTIAFTKFAPIRKGACIVLASESGKVTKEASSLAEPGLFAKAFAAAGFSGKIGNSAEILAPAGSGLDRIVAIGAGKLADADAAGMMRMGGAAAACFRNGGDVTILLDSANGPVSDENAAQFALGILLRRYSFDKYKTVKGEDTKPTDVKVTIQCANPAAAKKAFADAEAVAEGVMLARNLVNEPANILGPVEFAAEAKALARLGVDVEILTEKEMKKLGMGALLGVAQGSVRPARMAVMQWKGGKIKDKPVAFIGKGVVFDSGGISIKPAGGMEDMKGDMGGAAAVTGLMRVLAGRKARVNVVGIIGLVENMVDGNAQRPGDIVTSMSGQTIEVLNTDAEGRLVLADALWYCNQRFAPRFMVNLATLTGAIMIALGQSHAGLFSNDDDLATKLTAAGLASGEKLWRMPMGPEYDKLIDTKNADMKNIGGKYGGSITAAQFLKRFVKETPWAHLDIAGTAMGSPTSETNQSWGSGFGVRLLDQLLRDNYES